MSRKVRPARMAVKQKKTQKGKGDRTFQLGMAHLGARIGIKVLTERRAFYEAFGVNVDTTVERLRQKIKRIERNPNYRGDAEPYGA